MNTPLFPVFMEHLPELSLRLFQYLFVGFGEILPRAVDIKIQHEGKQTGT